MAGLSAEAATPGRNAGLSSCNGPLDVQCTTCPCVSYPARPRRISMDCHLARRDAGTQVNADGAPCRIVALNTLEWRDTMFQHKAVSNDDAQATRPHRDIGPIATTARLVVGLLLVGLIVYGQLSSGHLSPATWALGLIGFPALVLAWHYWRIHRNPACFSDTSVLSFVLSIALPVALYFTGGFVPPLWFTSDATLIFLVRSLLLPPLRAAA